MCELLVLYIWEIVIFRLPCNLDLVTDVLEWPLNYGRPTVHIDKFISTLNEALSH